MRRSRGSSGRPGGSRTTSRIECPSRSRRTNRGGRGHRLVLPGCAFPYPPTVTADQSRPVGPARSRSALWPSGAIRPNVRSEPDPARAEAKLAMGRPPPVGDIPPLRGIWIFDLPTASLPAGIGVPNMSTDPPNDRRNTSRGGGSVATRHGQTQTRLRQELESAPNPGS